MNLSQIFFKKHHYRLLYRYRLFKCLTRTLLTSTDKAFCKSCHGKNFGLHGYGYGQGAGVLSMDFGKSAPSSTAPSAAKAQGTSKFDGKPVGGGPDDCPRCGKRVYAAEKKLAAGRVCLEEEYLNLVDKT